MAESTFPRPIFVVGSGRSGTSVLSWSLGQHPNIMPLPETYWIGKLAADLGPVFEAGSSRGDNSHLSAMGITSAEFHEVFGRAVNDLTLRRSARVSAGGNGFREARNSGGRWVDSTPLNSLHIPHLLRLFPEAKFIHILRDVRSVVKSLMNFHKVGGARYTEQASYEYWLRMVRSCVKAEQDFGPEKVMRLQYADLISHPEQALRACLDHVGEPFHERCPDLIRDRKINSSRVSSDFDPREPGTDPHLRQRAESLSKRLLAER